jgi:hypothetical protein
MIAAQGLAKLLRTHLPAVLVLTLLAAPRARAQDVTGEWDVKMDFNGRETFATLVIAKGAGGALTGKWGSSELSDVKFDGQKLSFVRTMRFGDQEFKSSYSGTLKDGSLAGAMSSDRGDFPANASRRKPKSPALGRWRFKYTVGDRDIDATLAVSEGTGGALDGKWTSNTGEHTVSNVKFQDGKLTFARKVKLEEREFDTTYEGKVDGNKVAGNIKSEAGDIPANAERVGADLIGRWELTSNSDQGPRTRLLTVFGDLSGRYESFGGFEVPVKEIKVDGSQVAFSVETSFGDQTSTIDFKGKLEGQTLKAEVTSPRGTREFTGKKVEAPAPSPAAASAPAPAPKPGSAVAGIWEITREGRDGTPRTVTLVLKDDLTGTYTDRDATTNVTDVRVEGDQLSFKVTVKFGDREVPTEFKGKIEGTNLKGQMTTSRGVREVTGKKKAEVKL